MKQLFAQSLCIPHVVLCSYLSLCSVDVSSYHQLHKDSVDLVLFPEQLFTPIERRQNALTYSAVPMYFNQDSSNNIHVTQFLQFLSRLFQFGRTRVCVCVCEGGPLGINSYVVIELRCWQLQFDLQLDGFVCATSVLEVLDDKTGIRDYESDIWFFSRQEASIQHDK